MDLELTSRISKQNTNEIAQKQITLGYIEEKYPNHKQAFTDGSKKDGRTASGAHCPFIGTSQSTRIDDQTSILTAELHAIATALRIMNRDAETGRGRSWGRVLVLTDSKSAAQVIASDPDRIDRTDIWLKIAKEYTALIQHKVEVTILWIPAHCGIEGNEVADFIAKDGTRADAPIEEIGVSNSEAKSCFKATLYRKIWQKSWEKSGVSTTKLIPYVNYKMLDFRDGRIGRLLANRPRFCPHPNAGMPCLTCDRTCTVPHVLVHCQKYEGARARLAEAIGGGISEPGDILHVEKLRKHKKDIITFLNQIDVPI